MFDIAYRVLFDAQLRSLIVFRPFITKHSRHDIDECRLTLDRQCSGDSVALIRRRNGIGRVVPIGFTLVSDLSFSYWRPQQQQQFKVISLS